MSSIVKFFVEIIAKILIAIVFFSGIFCAVFLITEAFYMSENLIKTSSISYLVLFTLGCCLTVLF